MKVERVDQLLKQVEAAVEAGEYSLAATLMSSLASVAVASAISPEAWRQLLINLQQTIRTVQSHRAILQRDLHAAHLCSTYSGHGNDSEVRFSVQG